MSRDELGAHVSSAGGVQNAPARAQELDAVVLQLFTKQPSRWAEPEISSETAEKFRAERDARGIVFASSHDSYLINLASSDAALFERSCGSFRAELMRCAALGLDALVTHPGNATGGDVPRALEQNAEAVAKALADDRSGTVILFEATAGSGTALGASFGELGELIRLVGPDLTQRVGVCLDTCHVWAAGYDLVNRNDEVFDEFDEAVGIERIGLFHLNDSVAALGSRRDRHAHIGQGQLGPEPFRRLLNDTRFAAILKVIETPKDGNVLVPIDGTSRLYERTDQAPAPSRDVQRSKKAGNFCAVLARCSKRDFSLSCYQRTTSVGTPILEPNLPYVTAQQTSPWRAGTPGRAPRNMRAVVYYRRPLCLYVCLVFGITLGVAAFPKSAHAQLFPKKPSIQIRLGGFYSTPLVTDEVSSIAVDDSIPGERSSQATIRQQPGPIGTLALRLPLRSTTQLEVSASAGRSKVRGDDGFENWDVTSATIGNFVLGFGYLYRNTVVVRGGVGMTKLFAEDRGLFTKGNSIRPLIEGGVSTALPVGSRTIDLDLRVQTHSFATATLRDNGGDSGNVTRVSLQLGYTLWGGGR